MRVFIGIPLPPERSAALACAQVGLDAVRWVPPGKLHLTLAFLGEIDVAAVEGLGRALAAADLQGGEVRLRGTGCFGGRRGRPWVLWAGVEDPEGGLARLHAGVHEALRQAGMATPLRERFVPHLTLGRARHAGRAGRLRWMERFGDQDFGRLALKELTVFSSVPKPEGPEYRALFRRTLPIRGVSGP